MHVFCLTLYPALSSPSAAFGPRASVHHNHGAKLTFDERVRPVEIGRLGPGVPFAVVQRALVRVAVAGKVDLAAARGDKIVAEIFRHGQGVQKRNLQRQQPLVEVAAVGVAPPADNLPRRGAKTMRQQAPRPSTQHRRKVARPKGLP